jgi:hypothetical protein
MSCILKQELTSSLIKTPPEKLQTNNFLETFKLCEQIKDPVLINMAKGYYVEYLLELGKPI